MTTFDQVTFWIWLFTPFGVFAVWEAAALILRAMGKPVKTISMIAKDNGYQLNSVQYLWCSMPTHWWWNAESWGPSWLAVVFWVIPAVLLVLDVVFWRNPRRWWKNPLIWMPVGALAGRFLFPQAG